MDKQQLQGDPYNEDTIRNKKSVLIIEVSAFYLSFENYKSIIVIELSTFQGCPQGGAPLYHTIEQQYLVSQYPT